MYLLIHHSYVVGALALAWPLGLCGLIFVPGKIGQIEMLFAQEIGYVKPE